MWHLRLVNAFVPLQVDVIHSSCHGWYTHLCVAVVVGYLWPLRLNEWVCVAVPVECHRVCLLHYWPFVWGIRGSPVDSPIKIYMRSFDVFFATNLNKLLNMTMMWRHGNVCGCVLCMQPLPGGCFCVWLSYVLALTPGLDHHLLYVRCRT